MSTLAENVNLEVGCYVDGHWGQFALVHLIEQFSGDDGALGLAASWMAKSFEVDDDLYDELVDIADRIESALNELLPENMIAHWHQGEFSSLLGATTTLDALTTLAHTGASSA